MTPPLSIRSACFDIGKIWDAETTVLASILESVDFYNVIVIFRSMNHIYLFWIL